MNIFNYLNSAFCIEFAIALVHFLWQGFAIAGIAMIIVNIFGKKSSRFRYGVYVASLFVMIFTLGVTYALIDVQKPRVSPSHYAEITPANKNIPEIVMESNPSQRIIPDYNPLPARYSETEIAEPYEAVKSSKASFSLDWRQFTPYLTGFYFIGVIVMTCRLLLGLHGGQRLRKISEPVADIAILDSLSRQTELVGLNFIPAILFCKRVLVPTVVGVFKPSILLPLSFASGLSSEQIEMLLAHELAHIRRYDPLVNIVQRIIEALLFFHPAVWYISHKIRIERENCCDDIVLQIGGKPAEYALCLVEIAQQTLSVVSKNRIHAEVMNAANNPSKLSNRIRRLLGSPEKQQIRVRHTWLIGLLIVVFVGVLVQLAEFESKTTGKESKNIKATENKTYKNFLFVKKDLDSNGKATGTASLMMAEILSDGFDIKRLYSAKNNGSWRPLGVIDGVIYFVHSGILLAIDMESSQVYEVDQIDHQPPGNAYRSVFQDGLIYLDNSIFDCHNKKYLPSDMSSYPRDFHISPNKKKMAYITFEDPGNEMFILNVMDITSGHIEKPCPPFRYFSRSYSISYTAYEIPFMWIDSENILLVRTEGTFQSKKNYLMVANIKNGTLKDFSDIPVPDVFEITFMPSQVESGPVVIFGSRDQENTRYRVDLESWKLIPEDTKIGEFRLHNGGLYGNPYGDYYDQHWPDELYHGDKLISSKAVVSICPDGKQTLLIVTTDNRNGKNEIQYYNCGHQEIKFVEGGQISGPLLWISSEDMQKPENNITIPLDWEPRKSINAADLAIADARGREIERKSSVIHRNTYTIPVYDKYVTDVNQYVGGKLLSNIPTRANLDHYGFKVGDKPEYVFEKQGECLFYMRDNREFVPVRGSTIAQISVPDPQPEQKLSFINRIELMSKEQIIEQMRDYLKNVPKVTSIELKEGMVLALITSNKQLIIISADKFGTYEDGDEATRISLHDLGQINESINIDFRFTNVEDRLTILSNDPNGANEDAEELMRGFQQALKISDWNKALSLCSDKVKSYAANFESLEKFFNDVVPVEKIKELKEVQVSGYGGQVNMRGLYQCFIRLLEPDSVTAVKWEPTISWVWYLQKNSSGWEIDFQQIPLNEWIEQDTNRKKNEHEQFLERQRILREGLKLTLIPLSESFTIGKPMEFRFELKNISGSPIEYWSSLFLPLVNDPMTITAPDGKRVKYIAGQFQTGEAPETIDPNQTIVLEEKYDVAGQYLITSPGTYTFQFTGYSSSVVKSNIVKIEVKPGKISDGDLILQKLIEIAPKEWEITKNRIRDNGISISMIGDYGRKATPEGPTGVIVLVNPSKSYLEANVNKAEFFGQSKWGDIYINSLKAETLWPDYKEKITQVLEIKTAENTTRHNEEQWGEAAGDSKTSSISGYVLTETGGTRVAGATVELWSSGNGRRLTTVTKEDGSYVFRNVERNEWPYQIYVDFPAGKGIRYEKINVDGNDITNKVLYTSLPQSISGTVRNEKGEPVEGATIHINRGNIRSVDTDANGKYTLYLDAQKVNISCTGKEAYCLLDESGNEALEVNAELTLGTNEAIENVDFTLRYSPLFTGRVFYPNGEPAANADVRVEVSFWNPNSDFGAGGGFGSKLKTDVEGKFAGGRKFNGRADFGPLSFDQGDPKNLRLRSLEATAWLEDGSMGAKINIKPTADGNSFEPMEIILAETGSATVSENIETGVILDVNDTIKYIEIDGQKKEVDWILKAVTSYTYEKNLHKTRYYSNWFLKKPDMEESLIASDVSKFTQVDDIKVSPDGRYLAVCSIDILGSPMILEVIDLPLLLEQNEYKVVQVIDPFPGGVVIDKWDGDKLIISSNILLTHLDKDGRVPDDSLGFLTIQQYSLSINDGHIEGVTEIAKNPAAYFLKQFATNPNNMYQSAKALVYLKETSIISKLEKIMAQETDAELKARMQEVIDSVFFRFNLVESFNVINKDTTESELRRIYGNENVINDDIPIGEGEYEPGNVIYPKDETKKLEIVWGDLENKRFPKTASISGTKSKWQISNRVTLGTKLSELERYNGRPFVLTGFGYDYSGTIIDWKYGNLKQGFGDLKAPPNRRVLLRLGPTNIKMYSQEEIRSVGGDRPFLSDNPIMRKIDPLAYEIIVLFNENSAFQEYSDDKRNFSWGKENQGLRCTALAPDIVEQGMNLHTIVKLQCVPSHLDEGVKQLNMSLHDAFLALYLKNKKTGETIIVKPHDPTNGMLWVDDGINTLPLDGNSIKPWEVKFPLATQRNALEPGIYQCWVEYDFPKEPTHWWTNNKDWNSFGFWSGTINSQSFDLEITAEVPKTAKVLLPKKLHYDKEKREITYSKEEAIEVELPVRNGCFPGMDIYFERNGEFVMRGGRSGFPTPEDSIVNSIDLPNNGKFIYKIRIFETSEPVGHMWAPEEGDYKVLWENTFEFAAE